MSNPTPSIHTWIHHTGSIWENATNPSPIRRQKPRNNSSQIDTLKPGQPLIILCYSRGDIVSHTTPGGQPNQSDLWDFVVTGDGDPGGYVPDVFVNNGIDIDQQLGEQGRCSILKQRLADS